MSTPDLVGSVSSVARMTIRFASTWSIDAGAARRDRGARVARHHAFHAGADERRVGANQRHRLALHVRAHQRAVGVVILEERNERGRDRNELLRRHVHEVDLVARNRKHVAGMAADDHVFRELAVAVDRGVRLGDV